MEHEVVVPLPVAIVRQALADRALIGRNLPGLTADDTAGTAAEGKGEGEGSSPEETTGRLRLRISGSTITYGGRFSLTPGPEDGTVTLRLEGEELRGDGAVSASLWLTPEETAEGTTLLRCLGELTASGRLTAFDQAALAAAGRRLIDRTVAAIATELAGGEEPDEITATVVYLEDRTIEEELDDDLSDLIAFSDPDPLPLPELPYEPEPALAGGPVRRSIVGRSAEEVDHAPPRGRYAPTPPAHSARARAASRWGGVEPTLLSGTGGERSALPWMIGGGVALIGGAVVLVRALRRR